MSPIEAVEYGWDEADGGVAFAWRDGQPDETGVLFGRQGWSGPEMGPGWEQVRLDEIRAAAASHFNVFFTDSDSDANVGGLSVATVRPVKGFGGR